MSEPATLTPAEAAARLGVSTRTFERYVAAGLITPQRVGPRGWRKFTAADVDRLVADGVAPHHP